MEFRQLEVFVAVAEYKSFSKAADSLFLSQSTASSHIKNLEKELQKPLFYRTTKHLQLTEEGKRFLPYAQRILDTKQVALQELCTSKNHLLRLGASSIPSAYLLPRVLDGFHTLNPDVRFSIKQMDSQEVQERILDGTLEIGFVGSPSPSVYCTNIPFCRDELVIVTPATEHYRNLAQKKCSYRTLLQEPMLTREAGSGTQLVAEEFLASIGLHTEDLHILAEISDPEAIKQLIIGGMGISVFSRFAVADLEKRGQAILYPLPSEINRSFYITYLRSKTLKPVLQSFIDYTLSFYREHTPEL